MAFYVVTTKENRDRWHGDSKYDRFCTEGVAERQFKHYREQGAEGVRLVHWIDGVPHLISSASRHRASARQGDAGSAAKRSMLNL
jgi:hypothetical protein